MVRAAPFLLSVVSRRSSFSSLSAPLDMLVRFSRCPHDLLDFPQSFSATPFLICIFLQLLSLLPFVASFHASL